MNYSILIANRLAEILDRKEISVGQFAQLMNKSKSQVSTWFKGSTNFTLDTIQAIEAVLEEPLICVTSESQLHIGAETPLTRSGKRYVRSLPSKPNAMVDCQAPALTEKQRDAKRNMPQVKALTEASQRAKKELEDPVTKELWNRAWRRTKRNASKHGSPTDTKGKYKVPRFLHYFVRKSLLSNKPLSYYYPELLTSSPADVLNLS